MNNSLLSDRDYVNMIQNTIARTTYQYVDHGHESTKHLDNEAFEAFKKIHTPESLQSLDLTIDPELFLDTLMMEIRRDTILYASKRKRERIAREQTLNKDLKILNNSIMKGEADENIETEFEMKKAELEEIIKYQAEGAYIRSRAQYRMDGERPTRLFCSLETYNAVQKYVPQLIVKDNDGNDAIISNQSDVEAEILSYYKELFRSRNEVIVSTVDDFSWS